MSFELAAEDLTRDYGSGPVLEPLSFTLAAGERLAVIGESGCGKSTLLGLLSGMEKPSRGRVTARFVNGSAGDSAERSPRSAFVWQNLGLFPWKRVLANLTLPLELAGMGKAQREARAFAMLDELGLKGLEKRWPASLSGGQRQRLALGRALIAEPDILFLDEPFSALDALTRERLQDFLLGLLERRRCTTVLVTHDIGEAIFLGTRVLVLGGRPARPAAWLENPLSGLPDSREREAFFHMSRRVHAALRGSSLRKEDKREGVE